MSLHTRVEFDLDFEKILKETIMICTDSSPSVDGARKGTRQVI